MENLQFQTYLLTIAYPLLGINELIFTVAEGLPHAFSLDTYIIQPTFLTNTPKPGPLVMEVGVLLLRLLINVQQSVIDMNK